jgi:hypothetical protein
VSTRPGPARALAASARLANLPSVLCNVWLGVACAAAGGASLSRRDICGLLLSGALLYLAGNFLNDWHDRGWDARHRPERALPRGLFPPAGYLIVASSAAAAGIAAAIRVHPGSGFVAMSIAACVLIYTRFHKLAAWPALPLAMCRALLPMLAIAASGPAPQPWQLVAAGALSSHTLGISLLARREHEPAAAPRCVWLLFPAAALLMLLAGRPTSHFPAGAILAALLPYALWTARELLRMKRPVPALLAGFPLLDWIFLLPFAIAHFLPGTAGIVSLCLPPAAWLAGLALQRLAPAT